MKKRKIASALTSLFALLFIGIGFWQYYQKNYMATLVLMIIGIILTVIYFVVSMPVFKDQLEEIKKKKGK